MDNFNKVLSFILGLVVVIVFFAVLTGRINLKNNFPFLSAKTSPTPQIKTSPTPKVNITPTPVYTVTASNTNPTHSTTSYNRYPTTSKNPSTIPSTGSPTFLLSFFFFTLGAGIYLKKKA